MDAFTTGILQRIRHAESNLHRAREAGDDYSVDLEQAELDDLRRIAAEHGVQVGTTA
jgi:predicted DNA-binding ribbon-helix-helix protein